MATNTRIYVVTPPTGSEEPARLVRASSQAQAIRKVVDGYSAKVAAQDDLVQHLAHGAKVEEAA